MTKLIAASAALLIAMAPTFTMAQEATDEEADVILIGPGVDNTAAYIAGGAGLLALALLLGSGDGSTTTTTTTTTVGGDD
ncbi:hypothetical protein [Jannaschia formosa]|uniref:hypothetical protein n=1 Tax=Jannaschia formosa TaxID=2259592 RepID=UPI0010752995|nr:hypothetical protein [Jannaschia formosa]TFL18039.1 hypothetical protein DR046_11375 [Jannaschia formosa]